MVKWPTGNQAKDIYVLGGPNFLGLKILSWGKILGRQASFARTVFAFSIPPGSLPPGLRMSCSPFVCFRFKVFLASYQREESRAKRTQGPAGFPRKGRPN
jgi:hypothetical protein